MSKTGTNSALKPFVDLRGIQRVKRSPAPSYITGFTPLESSLRLGGERNQRKHQQRTPLFLTGFTLVEVLVTTAVLSLGIVLIYRAFFTLLDSFGYYSNYLRVIAFADEKLWQAQDTLSCFGSDAGAGSSGRLNIQNKDFNWRLSVSPVEAESLYRIDLTVNWQEGPRIRGLTRNAYALYIKKEE